MIDREDLPEPEKDMEHSLETMTLLFAAEKETNRPLWNIQEKITQPPIFVYPMSPSLGT